MTVYVDDMQAQYGRMIMCHMLADTDEELHAMADAIGVARKWHQKPGTPHSHYDICMSKKAKAINLGAVLIGRKELVDIIRIKRYALAPHDTRIMIGIDFAKGPDTTCVVYSNGDCEMSLEFMPEPTLEAFQIVEDRIKEAMAKYGTKPPFPILSKD